MKNIAAATLVPLRFGLAPALISIRSTDFPLANF